MINWVTLAVLRETQNCQRNFMEFNHIFPKENADKYIKQRTKGRFPCVPNQKRSSGSKSKSNETHTIQNLQPTGECLQRLQKK